MPTPSPCRPLVLASTSPYRAQLLERLGRPFERAAPAVDEAAADFAALGPRERALALAHAKAEAVLKQRPEALVIGSDQVCALGGTVFDKPGTFERADATLQALAGQTHQLWTALVVLGREGSLGAAVDETGLKMRPLAPAERRRYLEQDEPFDCAGAYKIEAKGITLFDEIRSADWNAIVGLPLLALERILRAISSEDTHASPGCN